MAAKRRVRRRARGRRGTGILPKASGCYRFKYVWSKKLGKKVKRCRVFNTDPKYRSKRLGRKVGCPKTSKGRKVRRAKNGRCYFVRGGKPRYI